VRLHSRIFSSFSLKSTLWGILIALAIGAFIFTGFGSLRFESLWGMSDTTAAQVGQQVVTTSELAHAWGPGQRGSALEVQARQQQLLDSLINQKILVDVAVQSGFLVSEDEIVEFLRKVPSFQDPQSHTFSYALFQNFLAAQQINQQEFYKDIKNQLLVHKLQGIFALPLPLPPDQLKKLYDLSRTVFHLEYMSLEPTTALIEAKAQEKAKAFLQDPKNQSILDQRYEARKNSFTTPESFDAHTLLISYEGAQHSLSKRTKEEALQLAKQLRSKLTKKSQDWAYFSQQWNDDVGAKSQGGVRTAITEQSVDKESWQTLQQITTKTPLSDVIETPFGYRIWHKIAYHPAQTQAKEEVKKLLALEWAQEEIKGQIAQKIIQDVQEVFHKKRELNPILQEYGLVW